MAVDIQVEGLQKRYGETVAVDGLSFTVAQGEIFGLLGPNGAGKTTTVECLEGLRPRSAGTVRVLGMDPQREGRRLREILGIQLQESALPDRLRVAEACELFAAFYPSREDWSALLEEVGLASKRRTEFAKLSGGQKQRLFVVLALLNRPRLVFLDELTTGLDPQGRRAMWDLVRRIRDRGTTVVLTTHYMEEAEILCDRVAILDRGRLLALDSPTNLIRSLDRGRRLTLTLAGPFQPDMLAQLPGVREVQVDGPTVTLQGEGARLVSRVVTTLEEQGVEVLDLRTHQPNLEDVFLALTGRRLRE